MTAGSGRGPVAGRTYGADCVCHPLELRAADRRSAARSDQGLALTECVAADDVDSAGDETSGHSGRESAARQVEPDLVLDDVDAGGAWVDVVNGDVDQRRVAPIRLKSTPSHSDVSPVTVRLPPIVLFLIDQGMSKPPPTSVTLLLTVTPFSKTARAFQQVTLPLTVMVAALPARCTDVPSCLCTRAAGNPTRRTTRHPR